MGIDTTENTGLSTDSEREFGQEQYGTVTGQAPRVVTLRAIAIACGLIPLMAWWVVTAEIIWYTGHSTAISLFYHVTFTLFIIGLINLWFKQRAPQKALEAGEMMTIYVMLSIAGTLCSHDLLQILVPSVAFPHFNANPQNLWDQLILPYLSDWAVVKDKEAITGLALGNASLYRWNILAAWAKPLVFWSVFLLVLILGLLFLNVLLRRQWTEQERLSFPIIQIPLIISTDLPSLLKNRFFWIAFGIAAGIDIVNGINFFYPYFPKVPIVEAFLFRDYFVERPWDAIAATTINLFPFVIGLAFFLPTDLAFSCWFFFVLFKLEMVLASSLAIRDLPGFPFINEQAAGGYLGLGLWAIWLSRKHLIQVFRTVFGMKGGIDESTEPMRYRTALIGFLLCTFYLIYIGHALGAKWQLMVFFFVIFFLYSVAIARMRAELGPPAHDLHAMGPDMILFNAYGARNLAREDMAVFSLFFWFNRAYRAHFSAHSMEGFKVAQVMKATSRAMMWAIVIAVVVGIVTSFWALLHSFYVHGYSGRPAGDAFSSEAWNRMAGWVGLPTGPKYAASIATGLGLVFTLILGTLRMNFTWWLWHPVGYATCSSWSMEKLWACLFIGWLAKLLITRYGGAPAYRRAIPFFIGLVLGEFVVGSLWSIFGGIAGVPVYHFWG